MAIDTSNRKNSKFNTPLNQWL